jgi:molecular chaperone GrpE
MDEMQTPITDAAEDVAQDVAEKPVAQDELTAARAKADENMAGWQRATADYANLKREMERSNSELSKYAVGSFLNKLLPVVDSFRKATEQRPLKDGEPLDETRIKQWADGVTLIRGQLDSVLGSAGVKPIDQIGIPFDPNMHEAMMMKPATPEAAAGTVVAVLEPGYLLHEKVIRPAKVVVAE